MEAVSVVRKKRELGKAGKVLLRIGLKISESAAQAETELLYLGQSSTGAKSTCTNCPIIGQLKRKSLITKPLHCSDRLIDQR
jgi:hypothetical protein